MPRTKTRYILAAVAVAMAGARMIAIAQTRIDLKSQSKSVDFSTAQSTKPIKTGTVLPPICASGEAYLLLTGTPGSNIYTCIATNTWVRQGGSSLPAAGSQTGLVLTNTADTSYAWTKLSGDLTGAAPAKVTGMQGRRVADVEPTEGDVMTWTLTEGWRPSKSSNAMTVQLDGVTKGTYPCITTCPGWALCTAHTTLEQRSCFRTPLTRPSSRPDQRAGRHRHSFVHHVFRWDDVRRAHDADADGLHRRNGG